METAKSVSSCDYSPPSAIFLESKQNPDQEIDYKENYRYGSVFASVLVVIASVLVVGLGLLRVD